jgi:hypothetical protein
MSAPAGRPGRAPDDPACVPPTAAALLHALRGVFRDHGAARLPTEAVVAALAARLGQPITATRVTRTLKPLGVEPRQFRIAGRRAWGYCLSDLGAPAESRDGAAAGESRDTPAALTPVAAAPEPVGKGAARDPTDAAEEWNWRLALGWGRWGR